MALKNKKSLGQNWLKDRDILLDIADSASVEDVETVVEIGPGLGTLTSALFQFFDKVIAVELDDRLAENLPKSFPGKNLQVVHKDVLSLNLDELDLPDKYVVAGNIPYYITSPIIQKFLHVEHKPQKIVLLMQKEVAERMQAQQGSKAYGALSLAVQYYSKAEIVLEVPPESFYPRPKVSSAVISLDVYEKPRVSVPDEKLLFDLISAAFSQRRKTLVNALGNASNIPVEKEEVEEALRKMDLPLQVRGEALSLEEYAKLTRLLHTEGQNDPDAMTE
jgi:16S rRNA (adenine1518-N6/adenine1519-N6)-dimethyltransferase